MMKNILRNVPIVAALEPQSTTRRFDCVTEETEMRNAQTELVNDKITLTHIDE